MIKMPVAAVAPTTCLHPPDQIPSFRFSYGNVSFSAALLDFWVIGEESKKEHGIFHVQRDQ